MPETPRPNYGMDSAQRERNRREAMDKRQEKGGVIDMENLTASYFGVSARKHTEGAKREDDFGASEVHTESRYAQKGEKDRSAVFAVADGIGGMAEAKRASSETITHLFRALYKGNTPAQALEHTHQRIAKENHVRREKDALVENLRAEGDADTPELQGEMGSTIVVLAIHDRTKTAEVTYVGDSRVYELDRDTEELTCITKDHTIAAELLILEEKISAGISAAEKKRCIEEAAHSLYMRVAVLLDLLDDITYDRTAAIQKLAEPTNIHNRTLSRYVGQERPLAPETLTLSFSGRKRYLVCSDGINKHLTDEEIANVFRTETNAQDAARRLVNLAINRGGLDDMTALVVDVQEKMKNEENQ